MEYVIIGAVVAAALACPVLMCGPMLLRRLGILKGESADMSCMGTKPSVRTSQDHTGALQARRAEIDSEIARLEAAIRSAPDQVTRSGGQR